MRGWRLGVASVFCMTLSASCTGAYRVSADEDASVDGSARDATADVNDADVPPIEPWPDVDGGAPPDPGPLRAAAWVELAADPDERPPGRMDHFAVYDEASDSVLLFGGYDPYGDLGRCCVDPYIVHQDIWRLDVERDRWSYEGELDRPLLTTGSLEPAFDGEHNRVVLIGVATDTLGAGRHNLALDLSTYELRDVPPGPWPPQEAPIASAFDGPRRRLVVQDGFTFERVSGTWVLDLDRDVWHTIATDGGLPHRFHTTMFSTGDGSVVVHGGYFGDEHTGDLWQLDVAAGSWRELLVLPTLPDRGNHSVGWDGARRQLLIFGGYAFLETRPTVLLDWETMIFTTLSVEPAPLPRRDGAMTYDSRRRRALLFGGAEGSERVFDDGWAFVFP